MNSLEDRLRELGRSATSEDSQSVDAVITRGQRLRRRRMTTRVFVPSIAAAAVALVGIFVPVLGFHPVSTTEASQFLITVGNLAGAQGDMGARTAKYWYVKTQTTRGNCPSQIREIWQGHYRNGVVRQNFPDGLHSEPISPDHAGTWVTWDELWQLPTEPDELYSWVFDTSGTAGPDKDTEMWTVVWDLLRESPAPPALRQALYDVAARIPDVSITGEVTDALGRAGTRIERANPWGTDAYVIDPVNGVILESQRQHSDSTGRYLATYIMRKTVDKIPAYALPSNNPPRDNQVTVTKEELQCIADQSTTADPAPSAIPSPS